MFIITQRLLSATVGWDCPYKMVQTKGTGHLRIRNLSSKSYTIIILNVYHFLLFK